MTRYSLRALRTFRLLSPAPTWSAVTTTVWSWLPEATVALRFSTALIGFVLALWALLRRIRSRRTGQDG